MVAWLNSWMKGIIIAVIISIIIEMLVPNGNIKKYIKTVIGIYIMFVIISPIITKITGKEISIEKYIDSQTKKYKSFETTTIDTNYYIKETYVENIQNEITKEIQEKEYIVNKIQIDIEENEENYGQIKKIELNISKKNKGIEPIEISIGDTEQENKEEITEQEKNDLKSFLSETYGTEKQDVIINE